MCRTFESDLANAQTAEEKVANHIISIKGYTRVDVPVACKGYDLEFERQDRTNARIEVKQDLMYDRTGNIAVEFCSRGKLSGLSTTTADFWIYVLGDEYWCIDTESLKNLCKSWGKVVYGGDLVTRATGEVMRSSELYLIKVGYFKSIATKIN